jgi:hypothetical protein
MFGAGRRPGDRHGGPDVQAVGRLLDQLRRSIAGRLAAGETSAEQEEVGVAASPVCKRRARHVQRRVDEMVGRL